MLLQEGENCFLWVVCANMSLRCNTNICRLNTVAHTGSGLTLWIRIWASFVSCPPSACKADVVLSLSEANVKPWHVAAKVASPDIGGSVPYVYVTAEQDYSNIPVPPPHIWMPTGNRPGPHSRGLKSTAVNHHKSKAASNIPLTHWQTNASSNPPLQEQELLQMEARRLTACLLEAVWGKWRHARLTNQLGRVVVSCCNTADGLFCSAAVMSSETYTQRVISATAATVDVWLTSCPCTWRGGYPLSSSSLFALCSEARTENICIQREESWKVQSRWSEALWSLI